MPRELYNEGRVVGYSAYELYVKHALSEFPDEEPATEREWLAAQIGNGTSLILRIPVEDDSISGIHHVDFKLPSDSKLLTANTIVGTQFFGACEFTSENWANKVIDYGQGISNNELSSPETQKDASRYPKQEATPFYNPPNPPADHYSSFPLDTKMQFMQFMKIQDGLVLQPGTWRDTESGEPKKDFIPDYKNIPVIRLTFASRITTEFYILLTGFTNRSIIAGITGIDQGSTEKIKPENGDFLGPELYPWANKIVFSYPPIASYYIRKYMASGHENRRDIKDTDAGTSRVDNLRIDHDEDDVNTIFTSSYLYSEDGVTLVGPLEPGGDISIASKLRTVGDAANYIKVDQKHSDASHIFSTELTPSKIVSSKNELKVDDPKNAGQDITLTPSHIVSTYPDYLKVDRPQQPGEDIVLTARVLPGNGYLNVSPANGSITLTPSKPSAGSYIIISGVYPTFTISVNVAGLVKDDTFINSSYNIATDASSEVVKPIWAALDALMKKIGSGTSTIDHSTGEINWKDEAYGQQNHIPLGNMNIYSSSNGTDRQNRWIRCNLIAQNGDIEAR